MSAWIDILLIANHSPKTIFVRGNQVYINRGQFAYSEITLSKKWGWSRNKLRRFLNYLETIQQIKQQKNSILSLYTVINYENYQGINTENETTDDTTERQQKDINKNDKNDKNIDNKLSIQSSTDKVKVKKDRDTEIDNILKVYEEVYGCIPVDQKPRDWANHIKRLLTKYLLQNNSSLAPHESMRKFLISQRDANFPINFSKLQTIYYHLRSTVSKYEKRQREQNQNEATQVVD